MPSVLLGTTKARASGLEKNLYFQTKLVLYFLHFCTKKSPKLVALERSTKGLEVDGAVRLFLIGSIQLEKLACISHTEVQTSQF